MDLGLTEEDQVGLVQVNEVSEVEDVSAQPLDVPGHGSKGGEGGVCGLKSFSYKS